MKTANFMVLRSFIPIFCVAILFFVLILQLVDLFANLWRYINNGTTIVEIGSVFLYYIPKCISYSLPIATLFAVSFCLGNYQVNNELISLLGAGIPLWRIALPTVLFGVVLSVGGFFFEDIVVIHTFRVKNELYREYLNKNQSLNNVRPTVIEEGDKYIYHAEYYGDEEQTLSTITVIERDDDGNFVSRIEAQWADWNEDRWVFHQARIFQWDLDSGRMVELYQPTYSDEKLAISPVRFRKSVLNVDELPWREAKVRISELMRAGLPFSEQLTNYYKRFSFSFTPLIVALISASLVGRFRKHVLLMSLLVSLCISVSYYVMQLILSIMATHRYITPIAGAWIPTIFFGLFGIALFRFAKS